MNWADYTIAGVSFVIGYLLVGQSKKNMKMAKQNQRAAVERNAEVVIV